jgi:hypothetical protein
MLRIKSPQDLGAGIVFIVIGLAGLYLGQDLRFGSAARMGPGFFPYYVSWGIVIIGLVVAGRGFAFRGPAIEPMKLRPILAVVGSMLVFGFAMDALGLVFSAVALTVVAALAQKKPNWRETLLLAAGMTAFCAVVFVWALKQPLSLFGN